MFYKIKDIKPHNNYTLIVTFENDIIKIYDVKPLFNKWDIFNALQNVVGLFEQVKVDSGGYGISWNDELDLSCNELWNNGIIYEYH